MVYSAQGRTPAVRFFGDTNLQPNYERKKAEKLQRVSLLFTAIWHDDKQEMVSTRRQLRISLLRLTFYAAKWTMY